MTKVPDLENERINLPAVVTKNEKTVKSDFWPKIAKALARIPFAEKGAENAIAAYYCAFDPQTPARAKGILLAALAYFIMPIDIIPDFLAGLGFTDDMAVLATAISLIKTHMKDEHFEKARAKLRELA